MLPHHALDVGGGNRLNRMGNRGLLQVLVVLAPLGRNGRIELCKRSLYALH
jgi:hypothetical protein